MSGENRFSRFGIGRAFAGALVGDNEACHKPADEQ